MAQRQTTAEKRQPRKKRVTFTFEASEAKSVVVTGTFCDWRTDCCVLKKGKGGIWKTTLMLAPGRYEYRFLVDGEWRDDPHCTERVPNEFGSENCVLYV